LRGVLAAFVGGLAMNVWQNGVTYHVEVEGWCCSSKDEVSPPARFIRVLIYEHGEIVPSKLGRLKDSPEVFRVPEYFSSWLFVRSPANLMTSQPPFASSLLESLLLTTTSHLVHISTDTLFSDIRPLPGLRDLCITPVYCRNEVLCSICSICGTWRKLGLHLPAFTFMTLSLVTFDGLGI
jgi:hypothetical protein